MHTFANSEDPDEMSHDVYTQPLENETILLGNFESECDPSIYTMDHPGLFMKYISLV